MYYENGRVKEKENSEKEGKNGVRKEKAKHNFTESEINSWTERGDKIDSNVRL